MHSDSGVYLDTIYTILATVMLMGPALSPSETVSLLITSNLYEDALKIAGSYSPPLDLTPIVEGMYEIRTD